VDKNKELKSKYSILDVEYMYWKLLPDEPYEDQFGKFVKDTKRSELRVKCTDGEEWELGLAEVGMIKSDGDFDKWYVYIPDDDIPTSIFYTEKEAYSFLFEYVKEEGVAAQSRSFYKKILDRQRKAILELENASAELHNLNDSLLHWEGQLACLKTEELKRIKKK
jgi:hypothetical protein